MSLGKTTRDYANAPTEEGGTLLRRSESGQLVFVEMPHREGMACVGADLQEKNIEMMMAFALSFDVAE